MREIAGIFGLARQAGKRLAQLSQGEKKLLDVASAFALAPEVILLDEPTSGVSTAEKHGADEDADRCRQGAPACRPSSWSSTTWTWWRPTRSRIIALAEGKVLADLPPGPFFADPDIIATVVGKRRSR